MKCLMVSLFLTVFAQTSVYANTKNDPHAPISHCYHWLDESSQGYLSHKYEWAEEHQNELTFYTTPGTSNGSVAGPGLYCAKSPSGSYGYGNRVIRIDLVDDVVLYDQSSGVQYCGTSGETSQNSSECAGKNWDIKFYSGGGVGNSAWYVIQNPMAISHWSANSDDLVQDLKNSSAINDRQFQNHASATMDLMSEERNSIGEVVYYNQNARLSIVDIILEEPSKLDSIPPLNIVTSLSGNKDPRLSKAERLETYRRYINEALKSDEIPYNDYKKVITKDSDVKTIFEKFVTIAANRPSEYNGAVALIAIAKDRSAYASVSPVTIAALIEDAFNNPEHLKELSSASLSSQAIFAKLIRAKLQSLKNQDLATNEVFALPALIHEYYNEAEAKREMRYWTNRIFALNNSELKIIIDGEEYGLNESTSFKEQCQGLTAFLSDKEKRATLKYYSSTLSIGVLGSGACEMGEALFSTLKTLPKDEPIKYVLKGKIEKTPYTFIGNYLESFRDQCDAFYASVPNKGQVDEVFYSVNGAKEERKYNSESYWTSKKEVCDILDRAIMHKVPLKALVKMRADADSSNAKFIVTGSFENQPYIFYGNKREEIESQCMKWHPNIAAPSSVDEIYYSVNGSNRKRIYNSDSYWTRANELCAKLSQALMSSIPSQKELDRRAIIAKNKTTAAKENATYQLSGRFETQSYFFYGETKEDIKAMCEEYYPMLELTGTIDEIYLSLNGATEKRQYNSNSYWKSKSELCNATISALGNTVPTVATMERRQEIARLKALASAQSSPYQVSGRFEGQEYFFYGINLDEISKQCDDFYSYLENQGSIDKIFWSVNGSSERSEYNSSGYWSSKRGLCGKLESSLSQIIPSAHQIEGRNLLQSWSDTISETGPPLFILGTAQGQKFAFYGADVNEIESKCEEFYEYFEAKGKIDRINYSINNGGQKTLYNQSSYWSNKRQLCGAIRAAVENSYVEIETAKRFALAKKKLRDLYPGLEAGSKEVILRAGMESLFLQANSSTEAHSQCLALYPEDNGPFQNLNTIRINTDNKGFKTLLLKRPKGREEFCEEIRLGLVFDLPSERLISHKNMFDQGRSKYRVLAQMNQSPMYFFGEDSEEIKRQCLDIYAEELDQARLPRIEITWRVLPDEKEKEIKLNDALMEAACEKFAEQALKGKFGRFLRGIF